MSAEHAFDMSPIYGLAYGSDQQFVTNQNKHDWTTSHFMWDGPHEGIPDEKIQAVSNSFGMTPLTGNDWKNDTKMWPIPTTDFVNESERRKAKNIEVTKLALRMLVTLPKSNDSTSVFDLSVVPDMALFRVQIILYTLPIEIGVTDISTIWTTDATNTNATWGGTGSTYLESMVMRKLYDNKVMLRKGIPRLSSMTGVPESGSAEVTATSFLCSGDMAALEWSMRDMSLMQKFSAVTGGQSGTVWNGLVIKFASKYMAVANISAGLTVQFQTITGFINRTGVDPKPSMYIDRFGVQRGSSGPRTSRMSSYVQAAAASRKRIKGFDEQWRPMSREEYDDPDFDFDTDEIV